MPADCASLDGLSLQLPLLGDENDRSGNEHTVTLHGAVVDENGARFDGSGDYITVSSFDYYSDASFSISYWMTKEGCTSGVYEYVYSHQQARDLDLLHPANSNVNMYLACESTGGGWSTSAGSVIRFLLQDSSGSANYARFDYPLHDAGDFDAITNRWVHIVLSVDGSSSRVETYADGQAVRTGEYGYYVTDMAAANTAYPNPGALTSRLTGFNLLGDIFLGSRSDAAADRHFVGRLAGVAVSSAMLATEEAQCLFDEGEELLPSLAAGCPDRIEGNPSVCIVSLLDSLVDTSQSRLRVRAHGHAVSQFNGAVFDGDGDYITIQNVPYAANGDFSVSFWFTKELCTGGIYEYLFSHHHDSTASWDSSSFVNAFLGCEASGGGWSSSGGSVVRYNLRDESAHEASFDFRMHDAGDFDAITHVWMHVILSATRNALYTYVDGVLVPDDLYGYYTGFSPELNSAEQHGPSDLEPPLRTFDLRTEIHIGARADLDAERHFVGRIAVVNIYAVHLSGDDPRCITAAGEAILPVARAIYRASGALHAHLRPTVIPCRPGVAVP